MFTYVFFFFYENEDICLAKMMPMAWPFQQEPQQREFKDWIKLWMVKNPWSKDISDRKAMLSVPSPKFVDNQVATN